MATARESARLRRTCALGAVALTAVGALGAALRVVAEVAGELPVRRVARIAEANAAALRDDDIVIGVVSDGKARAYPVRLLWMPESHVVNDTLGDRPIAASWCPLALSGAVYARDLGPGVEFGALEASDRGVLQLYDTATHSRWNQISGQATTGPLRGHRLRRLPSLVTTWRRWRTLHPETTIYTPEQPPPLRPNFDEEALSRVVLTSDGPPRDEDWAIGLEGAERTAAFLARRLTQDRTDNEAFEGRPIVAFMTADLTTVVVWDRRIEGRTLTFAAEGDQFRDAETGSSWDAMRGIALTGPLAGKTLDSVPSIAAIWRAWRLAHPDTLVFGDPAR